MSMEKIKKPTAQEVFDIFLLALQDEEIKIAGDIEGFKNALYEGFKDLPTERDTQKKCCGNT